MFNPSGAKEAILFLRERNFPKRKETENMAPRLSIIT